MSSTRGSTLRNRRTVLVALVLAIAAAIAAFLLTRTNEMRHARWSSTQVAELIESGLNR